MCLTHAIINIKDSQRRYVYKVVYPWNDTYFQSLYLNQRYKLGKYQKAYGKTTRTDQKLGVVYGGAIHVYPTLKDAKQALNGRGKVIIKCEVDPLDYICSGDFNGLHCAAYRGITPVEKVQYELYLSFD